VALPQKDLIEYFAVFSQIYSSWLSGGPLRDGMGEREVEPGM